MVEIFIKPGTNSEVKKYLIFKKTDMISAVYDNGTHYVTNHRLTSEMLREICEDDDVIEVTGEYTGGIGGWGASHEHREHRYKRENYHHTASSFFSLQKQQQEQLEKQRPVEKRVIKEEIRTYDKGFSNKFKTIIYTAVGIFGAVTLAGFIISGGLLPNVNKGTVLSQSSSIVSSSSSLNLPLVLGAIHGYVAGPAGLPAIGATVMAAEQQTDHTVNSIISIDGNYYFQLPAGKYNVIVAYPDGMHRAVSNFEVQSGSAQNLDFKY